MNSSLPEKRSDGCWVKNIVFNFPVPVGGVDLKELPLENATTLETICLLSREKVDGYVELSVDAEMLEGKSGSATYGDIKAYVEQTTGLKVSSLYIGQMKDKYGIKERKNYNHGSGNGRVPNCPPEKEEAIVKAFEHFGMI